MNKWNQFLEQKLKTLDESTKNWIQKSINPKHKGFCSPTTKKTCTPRRKALAMRFKKGDLHHKGD